MDGQRFDQITRALTNVRSRRGILKTLAAATLGGLVGARRTEIVSAVTCEPGQVE